MYVCVTLCPLPTERRQASESAAPTQVDVGMAQERDKTQQLQTVSVKQKCGVFASGCDVCMRACVRACVHACVREYFACVHGVV